MNRRWKAHTIAVALLLIIGCSPSESERRTARIKAKLPPALQRAHHLADQYRFNATYGLLYDIEDEIEASGLELAEERQQIREAFREIAEVKSERYRLTQLGHVVFDGKLIPGEERDRILAEREAVKQRRRAEQKRIAEERELEGLRLLEEKQVAEERARQEREAERARREEGKRQREEAERAEQERWVLEYVRVATKHGQLYLF